MRSRGGKVIGEDGGIQWDALCTIISSVNTNVVVLCSVM